MSFIKNIIVVLILFSCLNLEAQNKDSADVAHAAQNFLKAFTEFDWITFKNCFSKDATVFFPEEYGKRKSGQIEIEAAWKEIFTEFIDSSKSFDLQFNPQNMFIQIYGNSAVVTFHMGEETDYLSRRTLIFIKETDDWKIVHLHASGLKQ